MTPVWISFWLLALVYGYGVQYAQCPADPMVRNGGSVSSKEAEWIKARDVQTTQSLSKYLLTSNLTDFDSTFLDNTTQPIRIGLAFLGGGYRAMLAGAGAYAAFDERTIADYNPMAGILQSLSYISGLLGGAWMVGSLAAKDFPSIDSVINEGTIWDLNRYLLNFKGLLNTLDNTLYIVKVATDVIMKLSTGMPVTITDLWARLLSYSLLPEIEQYGSNYQISHLQDSDAFKSQNIPFPLMVSTLRKPQTLTVDTDSVQFEMNPYEFGSYDPRLRSFVNQQYLGTLLEDGVNAKKALLRNTENSCRDGFDNLSFEFGCSSSVFNYVFKDFNSLGLPWIVRGLVDKLVKVRTTLLPIDVAQIPNPFMDMSVNANPVARNESLFLCDGAFDDQNVPLAPLLQKERALDLVFASDNGSDDHGWPDGASLVATYKNQFTYKGSVSLFPPVPSKETFLDANLTARPVFFGCYAEDMKDKVAGDPYHTPLVVYLANRPFAFWSNTSTFKLRYTEKARNLMIQNGFEVATRLNSTLDSEWSTCVGCAIIQRERERQGLAPTDQCQRCFNRYCWDDTEYKGPSPGRNFDDYGRVELLKKYGKIELPGYFESVLKRDEENDGYSALLDEKEVMKEAKGFNKPNGHTSVELPVFIPSTDEILADGRLKRYIKM